MPLVDKDNNPFSACQTISDVFVALSEMQRVDQTLPSSSHGSIQPDLMARNLYCGILKVRTALSNSDIQPDLDQMLDLALVYVTEAGEIGLRTRVKDMIKTDIQRRSVTKRNFFIPHKLAKRIMGESHYRHITANPEFQSLRLTQWMMPSFDRAVSFNELLAMILEAPAIPVSGDVFRRTTDAKRLISQIRLYQQLCENGTQDNWPMKWLNTEIGRAMMTGTFRSEQNWPEIFVDLFSDTKIDRGEHLPPSSIDRHEGSDLKANFALAAALSVVVGGIGTCSVATVSRFKDEHGDFGLPGTASPHVSENPHAWVDCTPEQFAMIQAYVDTVRNRQFQFALALAQSSQTGLLADGTMSRDASSRVRDLRLIDNSVSALITSHIQNNERVKCFYEEPVIIEKPNEATTVTRDVVASSYNKNFHDDEIDTMGYNTYHLQGRPISPAAIWHELAHGFARGKQHSTSIPSLNRDTAVFSQAVLTEQDYPYYLTLLMDTADTIAEMYLQLIRQNIEKKKQENIAKGLSPATLQLLRAEYLITPDENRAWSESIARTFFLNYTVLNPLGVTASGLAEALRAGQIYELANELVNIYFDELVRESGQEPTQERSSTTDLRPSTDTGKRRPTK